MLTDKQFFILAVTFAILFVVAGLRNWLENPVVLIVLSLLFGFITYHTIKQLFKNRDTDE